MASSKEVKNRIQSIQDTMKITNAMFMISSAKLRKARSELEKAEPYFLYVRKTMAAIDDYVRETNNIYRREKPDGPNKKYAYLILTADKGLSGAYNHNIVKLVEAELAKHPEQNSLYVAGRLGRHYFRKQGENVMHKFHHIVQEPSLNRARTVSARLLDDYRAGEFDELYIVYSDMVTPMSCEARIKRLLPINNDTFLDIPDDDLYNVDIVELFPSADEILNGVVPIYLHGMIYGALVESFCSEQNSRMMAMQSATNNARDMLHDLSIEYNRIRQGGITQEITEVIGGAKAQKRKS